MALVQPYSGEFGPPLNGVTPDDAIFWDPMWFFPRYFKVQPFEGGAAIPFNLNDPQVILSAMTMQAMAENKRIVHVKPRKEGSSTFFTGVLTEHTLFREGCQALILAQKSSVTTQLSRAAVRFYNNMPAWMRPARRERVERSIDIPALDSWMSLATAGEDDPGRGFTGIQAGLFTEICKWKDASTWTAVLSNIPKKGAFIVAESTPLHHGDELQRLWKEADTPDSPWLKCFVPWVNCAEYSMRPPPGWKPADEVREYADKFHINESQAYWMQALGIPNCGGKIDLFRAEYPIDDMDCWRELGSAVFSFEKLHERLRELGVSGLTEPTGDTRQFIEANPDHKYVITVDPASSFSKRDFFGIQCLDLSTCEQAWESSQHGDAYQIAKFIVHMAKKYNEATVYVEANGVGDGLLLSLVHLGYRRIYHRGKGSDKKPGWWSDQRRKVEAFTIAQELLEDGTCCINSHRLLRQMQESLGPMGDSRARDSEGGHFDLTMAWCMAMWAYKNEGVSSYQARKTDAKELANRAWRAFLRKINGKADAGTGIENRWGNHISL